MLITVTDTKTVAKNHQVKERGDVVIEHLHPTITSLSHEHTDIYYTYSSINSAKKARKHQESYLRVVCVSTTFFSITNSTVSVNQPYNRNIS